MEMCEVGEIGRMYRTCLVGVYFAVVTVVREIVVIIVIVTVRVVFRVAEEAVFLFFSFPFKTTAFNSLHIKPETAIVYANKFGSQKI